MTTPFALLQDIASRSKSNAYDLPQQVEVVQYWRGVGFLLGGQSCLAGLGQVSEILHMPKVTRVPNVRNWVLGVANVRGRLVPVMDLAGMLGLVSRSNARNRRVLVVDQGEMLAGLLVDAVLGMQQFPQDGLRSLPGQQMGMADFVRDGFVKDERVWGIFRMDELIQSQDFLRIAV